MMTRHADARCVAHELAHIRGLTHEKMPFSVMHWSRYLNSDSDTDTRCASDTNKPLYAWALNMPLAVKAERKKRVVDVQSLRYQRTLEATKRWSTKLKRAQTELRKLSTRRRYYERALAARPRDRQEVS